MTSPLGAQSWSLKGHGISLNFIVEKLKVQKEQKPCIIWANKVDIHFLITWATVVSNICKVCWDCMDYKVTGVVQYKSPVSFFSHLCNPMTTAAKFDSHICNVIKQNESEVMHKISLFLYIVVSGIFDVTTSWKSLENW